jgi:hypothetical protein
VGSTRGLRGGQLVADLSDLVLGAEVGGLLGAPEGLAEEGDLDGAVDAHGERDLRAVEVEDGALDLRELRPLRRDGPAADGAEHAGQEDGVAAGRELDEIPRLVGGRGRQRQQGG